MARKFFAWLTVRRLAVAILFISLFAMATRVAVDPDMWWHLATGRYIVQQGSIPRHEVFSYTVPGRRWFTHEWLTEVVMYGLYRLGGKPALILTTAAVVTASFALVYTQCEAKPYAAVFAVLVAAVASAITWGARPQMVNILMMALFMTVVDRHRRGSRWAVWTLPGLLVLWVNMHSGFFLGLGLLGVILAGDGAARLLGRGTKRTMDGRQWRVMALALGLCIIAALVNPNGYHMLLYPFETLGSEAMQVYIQEWHSPNFHIVAYWPFALLLLGGAAAMVLSPRKADLTDMALFFGLGFAGLLSARHIPLFAVVAAPALTRSLADLKVRPSTRPRLTVGNWAILLLMIAGAGVWIGDQLAEDQGIEASIYPADALAYIRQEGLADDRVYNSYNWGGYLIWEGIPVYIDGRADVYMDAFINQYVQAYHLTGDWRDPLNAYAVDYVLIEESQPFSEVLDMSPEWENVYEDDVAVIFVREAGNGY